MRSAFWAAILATSVNVYGIVFKVDGIVIGQEKRVIFLSDAHLFALLSESSSSTEQAGLMKLEADQSSSFINFLKDSPSTLTPTELIVEGNVPVQGTRAETATLEDYKYALHSGKSFWLFLIHNRRDRIKGPPYINKFSMLDRQFSVQNFDLRITEDYRITDKKKFIMMNWKLGKKIFKKESTKNR